jgi:hypothetical protein
MKNYIIPLIAGVAASYCFASMVLNAQIVNPVTAFNNKSIILSNEELFAGLKDFEIISENRLRSTSNDPWIEVKNIRERVGKLRSVAYKVKPIGEVDELTTELFYADTGQDYHVYRSFKSPFKKPVTIIEIPDYTGPIDKLRLDLTSLNDIILEIEEISLNANTRFSALLFGLIYLLWCLVVLASYQPKQATKTFQKSGRGSFIS